MKKIIISALAIVGLLAFASTNTQAATGTISSTVNIECAVSVHANGGALAFGLLAASSDPLNPCNTWTISTVDGAPLVRAGLGNGVDFSFDHSKGSFTLTGSEPITYSVSISVPFSDPNLVLSGLTLSGTGVVDPSVDSHDCATVPVSVGGTLQVCLGATPGLHDDARILITANY